jgi:hypothetical protein
MALLSLTAQAQDIYKCADSDGHVTYSNLPSKTCKKIFLDPVNVAPSAKAAPKAASAATSTPASFPKVDGQTQKSRDGDRRRILEGELAAEQKNVEQAKKELAERMQGGGISGGKVQERVQQYRDKVAIHQRNVEAIQKEMSNLR